MKAEGSKQKAEDSERLVRVLVSAFCLLLSALPSRPRGTRRARNIHP